MIFLGNKPVEVHFIVDDITIQDVDAIINAANSYLQHGGGVAGIISRKGGPEIQKESDEYIRKFGPVKPGDVAITSAGKLSAKYIIHTVGPIGDKPENDEIMELCFINVLKKSDELGLKSIALPFVGTGIFGYPLERFIKIAIKVFKDYLVDYKGSIEKIIFCDIDAQKVKRLEVEFKSEFPNS